MTKVRMQALPGHLLDDRGDGFTSTVIEFLGDVHGKATAEASDAKALSEAVKAFGEGVAAANPALSFYVSVTVANGSKKFRGYDAADRSGAFGEKAWMRVTREASYGNAGLTPAIAA